MVISEDGTSAEQILAHFFSGKKKQHQHKLFGPDFAQTFLTLTPGCPGVKKFLPTTGAAGKRTFWCGRPRFSARTSMTRRVVEKFCTKKVCVDFSAPIFFFFAKLPCENQETPFAPKTLQTEENYQWKYPPIAVTEKRNFPNIKKWQLQENGFFKVISVFVIFGGISGFVCL